MLLQPVIVVALAGRFEGNASATNESGIPGVKPWPRIALDPQYSGVWVMEGKLDGSGAAEILSARNVDPNDGHYTNAAELVTMIQRAMCNWVHSHRATMTELRTGRGT